MIVLALDLAVIAIVALCSWRGYKNGFIRGVFGLVSLVVSLFLASVVASAYSYEFTEILSPFVGGVVDSALVNILEDHDEYDMSAYADKSDSFTTAYRAMRKIGLADAPSARIAELAFEDWQKDALPTGVLSDLITDRLSSILAFVAVFGIAFLLASIIFAVIGNLVGFVFSLPGLKLVDIITGALFGLAKGLLIIFTLATVVRYAGLVAPETISRTALLSYIINNNPIAEMLGV